MLVEQMKKEALKKGLPYIIDSCSETNFKDYLPADIIMLGPQMGHREELIQKEVGLAIPVILIGLIDYGMLDGESILLQARQTLEQK